MSKLKSFTQTSDLPYDRHNYTVYFKDGKSITFEYFEDVQLYWFQWSKTNLLDYITVLDKSNSALLHS